MAALRIARRAVPDVAVAWSGDLHPVLARLYLARGVRDKAELEPRLAGLVTPQVLGGIDRATDLLAAAIRDQQRILVAGDYDCDGATGAAVAVRGLTMLGARHVDYIVPDRFRHGYGLTPALVASIETMPNLIVTVDNGIASLAGVAAARARGAAVIVTDHHLPGNELPTADAIVNPRVRGTGLENLAGVGVMFYVLLALRAKLRAGGAFGAAAEPDLATLLDLVALGTVADVVVLDANNRALVAAGLKRIHAGRAHAGVAALIAVAGRDPHHLSAADIGFAVGPRINAAGRLDDMRIGVECLLTDDATRAAELAASLSSINRERRDLQTSMLDDADAAIAEAAREQTVGVTLYHVGWHAGVVGLVASKAKERLHRPVVAFAPSGDGAMALRGSARSIPGFHIRDALAAIDTAEPGLITRFGGHAMAAGLELPLPALPRFRAAFDRVARDGLTDAALEDVVWTDGELGIGDFTLQLAKSLRDAGPWGQGFPPPLFDNVFECVSQRAMGATGQHRRIILRDPRDGSCMDAVMFHADDDLPTGGPLRIVYELIVNDWQGRETPRLLLRHVVPGL